VLRWSDGGRVRGAGRWWGGVRHGGGGGGGGGADPRRNWLF